jgi:SAM-dependent methyltransferase
MTAPGSLPAIYARGGLSVELYDSLHPEGEEGMGDTAFLLEQAGITGGPVLELACGTGRVVWPFAEAGHEIVGLDLNRAMLERAEAKAAAKPDEVRRRVRFVESGMQKFDLGSTFALVFSTFRSFQGLLTVEEQRSCLRCAHRHLRAGGRLVLDLFDPRLDRLPPGAPQPQRTFGTPRHPVTGNVVLWESVDHQNDPVRQILTEIWRWTEVDADGRVVRQELEELRLRWTFRYELHHLLELCGFRLLQEFSDFRKSAPEYGRELVAVCEKA